MIGQQTELAPQWFGYVYIRGLLKIMNKHWRDMQAEKYTKKANLKSLSPGPGACPCGEVLPKVVNLEALTLIQIIPYLLLIPQSLEIIQYFRPLDSVTVYKD